MKKFAIAAGGGIALIIGIVLIRTVMFTAAQPEVEPADLISIDAEMAASHFGQVLAFRTIATRDPDVFESENYIGIRRFLASTYTRINATLSLEVVNDYSLLYTWEGSDPSLPAILLLAHMDVVPVDPVTIDEWTYPPFAGVVADGYIWGRGAIDNKGGIVAIMEAVEHLLALGFQPARTIYLAFGHDEEIGGRNGAAVMAGMLEERGVKALYLMDEAGQIYQDLIPGVDVPVARLGVAEKGSVTLELSVHTDGGHSSRPPDNTGLGILSQAVVNLENNQFKASLQSPTKERLAALGPYQPFLTRMTYANLWLFRSRVISNLLKVPVEAASIRSTIATTMSSGSTKSNILPILSTMIVNIRILPGDNPEQILAHVERVIDDPRVTISGSRFARGASPVTNIDGEIYASLSRVIREVFPGTVVAPNLVLGATDSRYYSALTDEIYRFYPTIFGPGDDKRIHGTDERQGVENFAQIIQFFARLLQVTASS